MATNRPLALITGASRGIGLSIAEIFAKNGYDLILTCNHSFSLLQEHASRISSKYQVTCSPFQVDMGCYTDVSTLFEHIEFLDVLVNNAGISHIGLLSDMTVEEWNHVISVNLDALFYTCKHAIPIMLKKHSGKIINISSVWGNVGASMEVAYSASKGGVNSFTRALAKELAPSNIQVNAIACGVIDTAMNACFSDEELEDLKNEIPCDRLGLPSEVAELVLRTVESPNYMTGQIITIDGGWY